MSPICGEYPSQLGHLTVVIYLKKLLLFSSKFLNTYNLYCSSDVATNSTLNVLFTNYCMHLKWH